MLLGRGCSELVSKLLARKGSLLRVSAGWCVYLFCCIARPMFVNLEWVEVGLRWLYRVRVMRSEIVSGHGNRAYARFDYHLDDSASFVSVASFNRLLSRAMKLKLFEREPDGEHIWLQMRKAILTFFLTAVLCFLVLSKPHAFHRLSHGTRRYLY